MKAKRITKKLKSQTGSPHRKLCEVGAKWLKTNHNWNYRCQYILIEFCPIYGESPDVFGLRSDHSVLIEVKTSLTDFKRDLKKPYRKKGMGIGLTRYYLCPTNVIDIKDLPPKWGLLYCGEDNKITVIKKSETFVERDFNHELVIMQSVIRRLAGTPKILDFRVK